MIEHVKKYINSRIAYVKLEVVDSVSNMIEAGIYGVLVGVFGLMILFMGSIAAGFLLTSWLDDIGTGFLLVMCFYIFLLILFFIFRRKIILLFTNNVVEAAMEAIDNLDVEPYEN